MLTGYFMAAARAVTRLLGHEVSPQASYDQQVLASQAFFQVCAVGLFICFAITVVIHLRLGRGSAVSSYGGPIRAWDALLIAASPVVAANGLINWDLLAVMLTSLGLLLWARKYPLLAGGVLGLAFAAKFYPVLVMLAITLLCLRADKRKAVLELWAAAVLAWLVVNLPMMAAAFDGWSEFWTMNAGRGADLGSIWYVFTLIGLPIPFVSLIAAALMLTGGLGVCWLVLTAPRRPRVAQIALLLMVVFLVLNKVYSPQYALWLLPLVVLARPKLGDVAVWTLGEVIYFVCIWGFLEGVLGPGSNAEWIYWAAVIQRICIQLWFALRVIDDIARPWEDPIRLPHVDDPVGGVLNHAADAAWMLRLSPPPPRYTPTRALFDEAEVR